LLYKCANLQKKIKLRKYLFQWFKLELYEPVF
jgi:hypothetical protein